MIKFNPSIFSHFLSLVHDKKMSNKQLNELAEFSIEFVKKEGKDNFLTQLETIRTLSY